jgi:hypothetical protein
MARFSLSRYEIKTATICSVDIISTGSSGTDEREWIPQVLTSGEIPGGSSPLEAVGGKPQKALRPE